METWVAIIQLTDDWNHNHKILFIILGVRLDGLGLQFKCRI